MSDKILKFELRYDPQPLRADLINIEAYRLSLNKLHLPREWKQDLERLHIVRSVHGTTAIEGNPLTEEEVANQLSQSPPRAPKDAVHRQTANAERAFRWIEEEFKTARRITFNDLCSMHQLLTEGSDETDNVPGKLRASGHNVTVGSPSLGGVHRAPVGGAELEGLVKEFIVFVNSSKFRNENVVIQALAAHFYFVTLHPFGNGNGRTTRCVEAAILFGGGYNVHGFYSLSNYFYGHRDEYFRKLQEARTVHRYDLTDFLRFGLRGFVEQLERINAYVRNRTNRLQYREMIRRCMEKRIGPRRRLINPREAKVLHKLLDLTKPPDPFSEQAVRPVSFLEVYDARDALYSERTDRTMHRELARLHKLGFVELDFESEEGIVNIRFEAIEKY